jgi:hypothetical protein
MLKAFTGTVLTAAWIAYVAASGYAVWHVLRSDPALYSKHYTLEVVSVWVAAGIALWVSTVWVRTKFWG